MNQFEYKIIQVKDTEEAEAVLNEWGKKGWRCKGLEHFFINIWDCGIILTLERAVNEIHI